MFGFVLYKSIGRLFWIDTVTQYCDLLRLLKTINNFFSPLLFLFIAHHIYGLTMHVKLYNLYLHATYLISFKGNDN